MADRPRAHRCRRVHFRHRCPCAQPRRICVGRTDRSSARRPRSGRVRPAARRRCDPSASVCWRGARAGRGDAGRGEGTERPAPFDLGRSRRAALVARRQPASLSALARPPRRDRQRGRAVSGGDGGGRNTLAGGASRRLYRGVREHLPRFRRRDPYRDPIARTPLCGIEDGVRGLRFVDAAPDLPPKAEAGNRSKKPAGISDLSLLKGNSCERSKAPRFFWRSSKAAKRRSTASPGWRAGRQGLGYKGLQLPTGGRLVNLELAAESRDYLRRTDRHARRTWPRHHRAFDASSGPIDRGRSGAGPVCSTPLRPRICTASPRRAGNERPGSCCSRRKRAAIWGSTPMSPSRARSRWANFYPWPQRPAG